MLKLQFDTANAAFDDPSEISRILRQLADRLDWTGNLPSEYPVFDLNGNRVGKLTIEESE